MIRAGQSVFGVTSTSWVRRTGWLMGVTVALLALVGCAISLPVPPIGSAIRQPTPTSSTADQPTVEQSSWQPDASTSDNDALSSMWDTVVANGDQPQFGGWTGGQLSMAVELPQGAKAVGVLVMCLDGGSSWTASLDEARWGGAACVSGGQIGAVELPIEASDHGVVTVA
ncbi:MAG: hypothetical protein FWD80_07610, partial [Propionibacteriaceae bacterium]|nr:hypothetical protein [Propionibacteriaceae bacterium]